MAKHKQLYVGIDDAASSIPAQVRFHSNDDHLLSIVRDFVTVFCDGKRHIASVGAHSLVRLL